MSNVFQDNVCIIMHWFEKKFKMAAKEYSWKSSWSINIMVESLTVGSPVLPDMYKKL